MNCPICSEWKYSQLVAVCPICGNLGGLQAVQDLAAAFLVDKFCKSRDREMDQESQAAGKLPTPFPGFDLNP